MAFPIIPLLIGTGVVAVAAASSGKKRKRTASKPQYEWLTDNLAVPRNPSAILQIAKWFEVPAVTVSAGPAATPEMIQAYGEEVLAVADSAQEHLPDVDFLWAPDWSISRQAFQRALPGQTFDPNKAWVITAQTDWANPTVQSFYADITQDAFGDVIAEMAESISG